MPEIKHILVPINATDESMKALGFAAKLAKIYGARISLLLVTYFDENTDNSRRNIKSWLPSLLTGSVSMYTQAVFEKAKKELPLDILSRVADYHVSGLPQTKILEFAKSGRADLIIMGCRQLSFFDSLIGGSVSRHILEKSTCPVIIVK